MFKYRQSPNTLPKLPLTSCPHSAVIQARLGPFLHFTIYFNFDVHIAGNGGMGEFQILLLFPGLGAFVSRSGLMYSISHCHDIVVGSLYSIKCLVNHSVSDLINPPNKKEQHIRYTLRTKSRATMWYFNFSMWKIKES